MSGDVRQEAGEEPGDGAVVGLRLRPVPAARARAEHAAPPQQQPRHLRTGQGTNQRTGRLIASSDHGHSDVYDFLRPQLLVY